MLAPASALNVVFCKLTYNGRPDSYLDHTVSLNSEYMGRGSSGENLNLNRLYVITSSRTASASEAVINGLKPYMKVDLIGGKTEGKNVGSVTLDDDRFEWELHPIVSRLSNKDGFSEYEDGFEPDFPCDESHAEDYCELGDEREYMLQIALKYITGVIRPESALRRHSMPELTLTPLYNSLDRKKTNGVLLDH
jgi:C-terminal processing protease CtpA/Prc